MDQDSAGDNPPVRTAMLIDDDETFLRHLSKFVERFCGLNVVDRAVSAEEALARVGRVRPTFILLDVSMQGMSGLDAIALLKAECPQSAVVVVSSMPVEYRVHAIERGAAGYVEKHRIAEDLPPFLSRESRNYT